MILNQLVYVVGQILMGPDDHLYNISKLYCIIFILVHSIPKFVLYDNLGVQVVKDFCWIKYCNVTCTYPHLHN